jgi:hypothetical protein
MRTQTVRVRQRRRKATGLRATSGFALWGEVLLVGVAVTVASLPVVTLPAALAAGVGHLRRHVDDQSTAASLFWRDLRDALWGGIGVGVAALLGTVAALFAIGLASADGTGVGTAMTLVGHLGIGLVGVAVLLAAGAWSRDGGWLRAVRGLRDRLDAYPAGALYLLLAVAATALLTWQFLLLLVPSLGLAALAVVAVTSRATARGRAGTSS